MTKYVKKIKDTFLGKIVTYVGRDPERLGNRDIVYYKGKAIEKIEGGYICLMKDRHIDRSKEKFEIKIRTHKLNLYNE